MTSLHKNLTGSDLHEPKGVAAADAGTAYIADGAGSGTWTSAYVSASDDQTRAKALTTIGVSPGNLGALEYDSGNISLGTGSASGNLSHGLTVQPKYVEGFLKCLSAEGGFSVGEVVPVSQLTEGTAWVSSLSGTLLRYSFSANVGSFRLLGQTGPSSGSLTPAKWALVIRARV